MNLDISRTDDAVRDALKKLSLLWKSRAAVNQDLPDRKSTRLNSSHLVISYPVFCLKKNAHHSAPAGRGVGAGSHRRRGGLRGCDRGRYVVEVDPADDAVRREPDSVGLGRRLHLPVI